jgi:siroheme synthase-like protein
MNYFPIAVKLKNRLTIVIGAGAVAQRKIEKLIEAGALVKVIAPSATRKIEKLAKEGVVKWIKRNVETSDIRCATLVIAATNDSKVNRRVSQWARKLRIPVNVVDKPALSNFISPALLRRKQALVAVYTDGKDPVLSRDLKNYLKENWNDFVSYRNKL